MEPRSVNNRHAVRCPACCITRASNGICVDSLTLSLGWSCFASDPW